MLVYVVEIALSNNRVSSGHFLAGIMLPGILLVPSMTTDQLFPAGH